MEEKTALETRREEMERAAVSSDGHQRQAAGEQRGKRARKQRHLVFEPDFAEDGKADAEAVDKVAAALGDGEAIDGGGDGRAR